MGGHDGTPEQCLPNQLVNFVDNIRAVQISIGIVVFDLEIRGSLGLECQTAGFEGHQELFRIHRHRHQYRIAVWTLLQCVLANLAGERVAVNAQNLGGRALFPRSRR